MYILIGDWVDKGHAINSAAHAGLMGYLEWKDDPIIQEWLKSSFRKVTCEVNKQEFLQSKMFADHVVITELAFDKAEVGLVFKPRYVWPKFFNYLSLWGKRKE